MAGFFGFWIGDLGSAGGAADFLQSFGDAVGVAGELDGGGVGEEFALAGNSGLDEAGEENADAADDEESDADEDDGEAAAVASSSATDPDTCASA